MILNICSIVLSYECKYKLSDTFSFSQNLSEACYTNVLKIVNFNAYLVRLTRLLQMYVRYPLIPHNVPLSLAK